MELGRRKNIDFSKYYSYNFKPDTAFRLLMTTCGANLISTVTGDKPQSIDSFNKNRSGWHTKDVIRYLRKEGITCIPLNFRTLLNTSPGWMPLTKKHVLIANVHLSNTTNSWFLLYNGDAWHNFYKNEVFDYGLMFFLNKPPQDLILLWKEDWK